METEKSRMVRNIIFLSIAVLLVASLFGMCVYLSIGKNKEKKEVQPKAVDAQETQAVTEEAEYLVVIENEKIYIYEIRDGENVFYDYAAVEQDLMSTELKKQLEQGLIIHSEAKLYEFLQTYSS